MKVVKSFWKWPLYLASGFSLAELLIVIAIIGVASIMSLRFAMTSRGLASLRSAALELAGYLDSARQYSEVSRNGCALTINQGDATIGPDLAVAPNGCSTRPVLQLRAESGLNDLILSGSSQISFAPRGINPAQRIMYLSIPSESTQMCVFISSPTGLVKRGFRDGASGDCDYLASY